MMGLPVMMECTRCVREYPAYKTDTISRRIPLAQMGGISYNICESGKKAESLGTC